MDEGPKKLLLINFLPGMGYIASWPQAELHDS